MTLRSSSMNARHAPFVEQVTEVCLWVSGTAEHGRQFEITLAGQYALAQVEPDMTLLKERLVALLPVAVIFDFSAADAQTMTTLVEDLRKLQPGMPVLGAGSVTQPGATLAALRAGVDDFIGLEMAAEEVLQVLRGRASASRMTETGRVAVLLGARGGLGVSTIACNLSQVLREAGQAGHREVALLDLGLPAGDGLLYMDMSSDFSFVDGVRNLKRMDSTLIQTTLARQASGVAVLPLPANLTQMREISHGDSVALIGRLRDFFHYQVADFGGFSNLDFLAQVLSRAQGDRVWVVCDQSLGGIVSTTQMLTELRERGVELKDFGLIVNRFDVHVDIAAKDIADRLALTLDAVLPSRSAALMNACSRGQLLAAVHRGDPFVQGLQTLARQLLAPSSGRRPPRSPWVEKLSHFADKWRGGTHVNGN
ncbi:histidine kinase [Polaromonas sp. SM01]|uniref:AAA family ATPase n=1 Tax=Polaromonas sp. SM01 TaxID=3085630 RepID=UPI002980D1D2|nr:histidine kinase [Polaromonas sp. SM01]MDW5441687.1 histidine kinase [Polaromonas sp. SM01]